MSKKIISAILILVLCFALAFSASAATTANVYDDANLLSDSEETQLAQKLSSISEQYNAQVVIMTVSSTSGSIDTYLEDVYDGMEMGYGTNHDGVLLLIGMGTREYRILSNGFAAEAITSSDIDMIGDVIVPDLSEGNYADAFHAFADECAYYLDGYINGFPFAFGTTLFICLIIGFVVGLIVALVLKGQLKSVRQQNRANNYLKPGSMQLNVHKDMFLYRNVTRTKKVSNNSSGGSGGSSRSTGGGSF